MAAPEQEASQRHLYSVTDIKASSSGVTTCITCNATVPGGQPCAKNSVDFSTEGGHYVWTCQGPSTVPRVSLHRTDTGQQLMLIADNKALSRDLAGKVLPQVRMGRGEGGGGKRGGGRKTDADMNAELMQTKVTCQRVGQW